MADIFLGYASEDREVARQVATALADSGWSAFWDRAIPIAKRWDETIEGELDAARCVVVLWSTRAVGSEYVRAEAGDAAERGILIPAFISEARLPLRFRQMQAANLVGWTGDLQNPEFLGLCDAIVAIAGSAGGAATSAGSGNETDSEAYRDSHEHARPVSEQKGPVPAWKIPRVRWITVLLMLAAIAAAVASTKSVPSSRASPTTPSSNVSIRSTWKVRRSYGSPPALLRTSTATPVLPT
jgi:hypothetical protein